MYKHRDKVAAITLEWIRTPLQTGGGALHSWSKGEQPRADVIDRDGYRITDPTTVVDIRTEEWSTIWEVDDSAARLAA
jgi:hypothetical protein